MLPLDGVDSSARPRAIAFGRDRFYSGIAER